MWKTQDGESLMMTEAMLESMAAATGAGGCTHCAASAQKALADEMGRMVRGARRTGTARSRRTGKRYGVYGGRRRGRSYRIYSQPAWGGGVIAGVSPGALGGASSDCDPDDDDCDQKGSDGDDAADELSGTVLEAMLDRG